MSPRPMQGNPTFLTGPTGLDLLAAATQAEALAAIGAEQAIEIIENANGTAIRFPGIGVQICIFDATTSTAASITWGNIFVSVVITRAFPAAFSQIPRVAPATRFVVGQTESTSWALVQIVSATSAELRAVSAVSGGSCRLGYIAIGSYTP